MSLSTQTCCDGAIILVMRTCFWCGGWPFRLPSLPRQQKHRETKNPTCLFNRTGDFVDWHGDIMPLGGRKLKFAQPVSAEFFVPPVDSIFWLVRTNRYVGNMKLTIHPHLSNCATDWPLFQLSCTNDLLGRQDIWASTQGPQISQRSWKPQVDRTLVGLELFWLWGGLSLHSNETGPQGPVPISQIQRHSEP